MTPAMRCSLCKKKFHRVRENMRTLYCRMCDCDPDNSDYEWAGPEENNFLVYHLREDFPK